MNKHALSILIGLSLLPSLASADTTLNYVSTGGCSGDFERIMIKDQWLRVDSQLEGGDGGEGGRMIYDGSEKLLYFIDDRAHRYMQMELDEDAIDLQADIMSSLRKYMRGKIGFDAFAMSESLCPELAAGETRDRLPSDPVDCGNGTALGKQTPNADVGSIDGNQLAGTGNAALMPGMSAESGQAMQQMLQQQMASMTPEQQAQVQQMMANAMPAAGGQAVAPNGGQPMPKAKPAPRIDRDAGEARVGDMLCSRRQHLRGDEMLREDCHAPVASLKLDATDARRIARFGNAMKDFSRSFSPVDKDVARESNDQVVIRRICYGAGQESGRATLGMNGDLVDEAIFAIPADYAPFDLQSAQDIEDSE